MNVRIFCEPVRLLKPLTDAWVAECNANKMGIDVNEDVYFNDMRRLRDEENSELFVLEKDNGLERDIIYRLAHKKPSGGPRKKFVGFMGLRLYESHCGKEDIATEDYLYVLPKYRGKAGGMLLDAAEEWAIEHGANHLLTTASRMASNLHDRLCMFYNKRGFIPFETSFIKNLKG